MKSIPARPVQRHPERNEGSFAQARSRNRLPRRPAKSDSGERMMSSGSSNDKDQLGETAIQAAGAQAAGAPRYFHLLWEEELDGLRGVLESLRRHRGDVLTRWHQLYLLHFGDRRSLKESEFFEIFGKELDATVADLLARDMDRFTADVRAIGEALAKCRVPFAELIVSIHLFEESAVEYFPAPSLPRTYLSFDKLSHCRMIVLA